MTKSFIMNLLTSILVIAGTAFTVLLLREYTSETVYNVTIIAVTIATIVVMAIPENEKRYWAITMIDKNHTYNTFTVSSDGDDLAYSQPIAPFIASGYRIVNIVEIDKSAYNHILKNNKNK